MKSLILASGFGTRLYPLTANKAKGLLEYKGKPIISYVVNKIPQDIDIFVNTNRKFESDFRRWQKTLNREVTLCIEPVFNEEQSLGAVGSLNYWVKALRITESLLVIASDNYFEFDLSEFILAYDGKSTLVAVYDIGDKSKGSQFGIVQLDGQKIVDFEEKPTNPKSSLVATACYIFPPRIFTLLSQYCSTCKRDNLGSFIAHLLSKDEIHAYTFTELWFDVGLLYR